MHYVFDLEGGRVYHETVFSRFETCVFRYGCNHTIVKHLNES